MDSRLSVEQEVCQFVASNGVLAQLKFRWQDEKEYEDFRTYRDAMKRIFESAGYTFISATEGFTIVVKKGLSRIKIKISQRCVTAVLV